MTDKAPEDELQVSKNVRLTSYVKTNIVVNGTPIYIGAEMSDDLLPDETFDDLSARIAGCVVEHLNTQITEARTHTTRTPK